MATVDDEGALLGAAAGGEAWAWARLHRDLAPPLRGYVAGAGGADPDAVVGEAFTRLARDLASVTTEGPTLAEVRLWAFLHARAVLHERRELDLDAGRLRNADVPPTVRLALGTLAPRQREALVLRVVAGLDDDDVATVLGETEEGAHRLVVAALAALDQALA